METIAIKVKNSKVLKLIYTMEELNLIEVLSADIRKPIDKLSLRLDGCLAADEAEKMHRELRQMRDEW